MTGLALAACLALASSCELEPIVPPPFTPPARESRPAAAPPEPPPEAHVTVPAPPAPLALSLESFSPARGSTGSTVTLHGQGPAGRVTVFFGGVPSGTMADEPWSELVVVVPDDARTGPISVLVRTSTDSVDTTSAERFTVVDERPPRFLPLDQRPPFCVVYGDCPSMPDPVIEFGCRLARLTAACGDPLPSP